MVEPTPEEGADNKRIFAEQMEILKATVEETAEAFRRALIPWSEYRKLRDAGQLVGEGSEDGEYVIPYGTVKPGYRVLGWDELIGKPDDGRTDS